MTRKLLERKIIIIIIINNLVAEVKYTPHPEKYTIFITEDGVKDIKTNVYFFQFCDGKLVRKTLT